MVLYDRLCWLMFFVISNIRLLSMEVTVNATGC